MGEYLHPLSELKETAPHREAYGRLYTAEAWLDHLLKDQVVPLRVCKHAAWRLLQAIQNLLQKDLKEWSFAEVHPVRNGVSEFETVFAAELQTLDTYFISQEGIYSTSDLIEKADLALDDSTIKVIPAEARKDFREAGRCLAFDLPTASGFHAMRATEAALRQYHALVVKRPQGTRAEMGTCINELRAAGADPRALAVLDQIRAPHRNPVMHPEVFLTMEEALGLFDIAKSAISAMANLIARITAQSAIPAAQVAAAPSS